MTVIFIEFVTIHNQSVVKFTQKTNKKALLLPLCVMAIHFLVFIFKNQNKKSLFFPCYDQIEQTLMYQQQLNNKSLMLFFVFIFSKFV